MKCILPFCIIIFILNACNTSKPEEFIKDNEVVQFNQLIYKDSIVEALKKQNSSYKIVWQPAEVNGNYAVVFKDHSKNKYCLVIRGSVIQFSNEGFHNWVLQDFNIFNLKPWNYTDTIQKAYISNGSYIGFQNLLLLKDTSTQKTLKEFIQHLPRNASLIISGHSLGGNLAQVFASYIWKEINLQQKAQTNIVTFGATAVGNIYFVKDLEAKYPNGKRYEIENDIAPKFPSMDKLSAISSILELDSVLNLNKIEGKKNVFSTVLDIVNIGATQLNIINEENRFAQSQKHLSLITTSKNDTFSTTNSLLNNILDKAYYYHKIDKYAQYLNNLQN